jgi:uncharacterized protein YcfJ
MLAKKALCTLAVGALFAAASPAFADPPRWAPAHGYRAHERPFVVERHYHHQPVVREVIVRRPVVMQRTVVVERPVYVERPIYYSEPVYAQPVYGAPAPSSVLGTIGGAIIGAAVGNQIGDGNGRAAATAIGAVVGGMLGSGRY